MNDFDKKWFFPLPFWAEWLAVLQAHSELVSYSVAYCAVKWSNWRTQELQTGDSAITVRNISYKTLNCYSLEHIFTTVIALPFLMCVLHISALKSIASFSFQLLISKVQWVLQLIWGGSDHESDAREQKQS